MARSSMKNSTICLVLTTTVLFNQLYASCVWNTTFSSVKPCPGRGGRLMAADCCNPHNSATAYCLCDLAEFQNPNLSVGFPRLCHARFFPPSPRRIRERPRRLSTELHTDRP